MLQSFYERNEENKVEALLKCLSFLSFSTKNQTKPHFRIYKFGNINNKAYL